MFNQEVYLKAMTYVTKAYELQKTSQSLFFLSNSSCVCMEVIHACQKSQVKEEQGNFAITCALLHNIIDNTNTTYDDLYTDFSPEIAQGVEALSKDLSLSKKEQFRSSIEKLLNEPYEVQMVKLACSIVNLNTLQNDLDIQEKKEYIKEVKFILSCFKNSNIHLSLRLEEKLKEFDNID